MLQSEKSECIIAMLSQNLYICISISLHVLAVGYCMMDLVLIITDMLACYKLNLHRAIVCYVECVVVIGT